MGNTSAGMCGHGVTIVHSHATGDRVGAQLVPETSMRSISFLVLFQLFVGNPLRGVLGCIHGGRHRKNGSGAERRCHAV
jgi:hypothetical protein